MSGWFEAVTGLLLLDPWFLLFALLVPVALRMRRWRGAPAVRFAPFGFTGRSDGSGHRVTWRVRLASLPRALRVLGLLLGVLALARPVQREQLPIRAEGVDILLCLDVSSSMAAKDLDPLQSRLDVARASARAFVGGRRDDRVGLLGFARYPDLVCPPTRDHRALLELLDGLKRTERDGPEDATGIGTAVARAAQALRKSDAHSKVVVLLTDGDENVASTERSDEIAPVHAGQLCKDLGIRVYTITAGVGREDPSGRMVPVDVRQVRRLAEKTGGRFYRVRDASALKEVYASIDELEKVTFEEPRYDVTDRFIPFLLAAMILLFLGRLLEGTVLEVLP